MGSEYLKYIEVAREEITNKEFGTTQQYLGVHEVVFEDGLPKVERIDVDFGENRVAIYFPIVGEQFYLEVHVSKQPVIEVESVWIESGYNMYLTATSEALSYNELVHGLNLKPLEGWSKGDLRNDGKTKYTFTRISFEPIKCPAYLFSKKLDLILDELEKDRDGIKRLGEKVDYIAISVAKYQYIGNGMIGGDNLSTNQIKRLADLNLAIEFDVYIQGTPF